MVLIGCVALYCFAYIPSDICRPRLVNDNEKTRSRSTRQKLIEKPKISLFAHRYKSCDVARFNLIATRLLCVPLPVVPAIYKIEMNDNVHQQLTGFYL